MTTATDRRIAREAVRRPRARRGTLIAALSSVVVLGGLALFIVTQPGLAGRPGDLLLVGRLRASRSRTCCAGFWLDVKLFVVVEIVVLVLGLVVAILRTTRAPALFPLRLLATVFTDVMRGVPVILVVYLIGFGIPALGVDRRSSPTRSSSAGSRSPSATRPTSPRSTAPASTRCTPASAPRRSRSGSPRARRCAT